MPDQSNRSARYGHLTDHRRFSLLLVPLLIVFAASPLAYAGRQQVLDALERTRSTVTTKEAWRQRRELLRAEFLKGAKLWPLGDERRAPKAIRHSRRTHGDYIVENVAVETLPGFYCAGNLYRPARITADTPIVLCPHGHFRPWGRLREDQQIRCAQLARMGATVFSYSMVGWDDHDQTIHHDPLVLALQTWNSVRAVDWLVSLPQVDAARIAITGASGGGTQSIYAALADERIGAVAPAVIVYPWAAPEGCRCEGGMPVMETAGTSAIELAATLAPRPQLLISVGGDATRDFPEVGFPFIQYIYGLAGNPSAVQNVHLPDEAHDYGPSKRAAVYRFLAEHLRLTPLDEERQKLVVEPAERLRVFDDEHPLPADAVRGSEQVAQAFARRMKHAQGVDRQQAVQVPLGFLSAEQQQQPIASYSFREAGPEDEAVIFTAPGFAHIGTPRTAPDQHRATLNLRVVDAATGEPTFCRVNVVGPDGHFYEPAEFPLKQFSLTGQWPNWPKAWGNRPGKAPIRYFGRFFYSGGTSQVIVPAGEVRIEVWKGFEYTPRQQTVKLEHGQTRDVEIMIERAAPMAVRGYYSGDPHVHIPRTSDADDQRILDLLEAEDVNYSTILAYNEPAGPYDGRMSVMDSPQLQGLGDRSVRSRGHYHLLSGQEYRSGTYGHLNLFLLDNLVLENQALNANNWPLYGDVAGNARSIGGRAFYAHGGYAQAIYADAVQGRVDGVELLQFGVYRGIGLTDWYHLLNCGLRFPAIAASDYPACRKLADCVTYVHHEKKPSFKQWLDAAAEGRSFVTTGPLLLLTVDDKRPGDAIEREGESTEVNVRLLVRSEVAPVTHLQLIANGRVVAEREVDPEAARGQWYEWSGPVQLERSAWLAARAYSLSPTGSPDAESHTNPVYVYLNDRAPYDVASVDAILERIDGQIAATKRRDFERQADVLAYFERSRDILVKLRAAGGVSAAQQPWQLLDDSAVLSDPGNRTHSEEELRKFLAPVPPKKPAEALKTFEMLEGFQMQLVAAEPLVVDPVAAAFDEHGNLFVAEMRDYPYRPREGKTPTGTIRLLQDKDGDGTFDRAHVFADQLLWPAGIAPWKGGIYVAAPPDIWYLKDTDGDHRADVRQRVYTGFGTANQQAMLNNLQFGLDHKIYGSTAGNGGSVQRVGDENAGSISVNGHDFRFDPVRGTFETVTGTVQFGNTFDDWGNRFLCSESQPLQHAVLPQHYLSRNPHLPVPRAIANIAPGPVPIFRISPIERWRHIRSSRRIQHGQRPATAAGASHHVIDAAAGVTVYRGGSYGDDCYGQVFIGGAQNNVIHRRRLVPDGLTFRSERVDEQTEFVRSSDNWFRPVNFVNAPDGTLYVLDMSREILESIHIPLDVVKYLDLTSGRQNGRIYRIAPSDFEYPGPPRLGDATTAELVAALESPHGWWRDTAHRLLYERQDGAAVEPLRRLLQGSSQPQARLHALWSLHGLNGLRDEDLQRALDDEHPAVRRHGLQLAEPRYASSQALFERLLAAAGEEDVTIRCQAAFSLGQVPDQRAAAALARIARDAHTDQWLQLAVLSSSKSLAAPMLVELLPAASANGNSSQLPPMALRLANLIGTARDAEDLNLVLTELARPELDAAKRRQLLRELGSGLARSGSRLDGSDSLSAFARKMLEAVRDAERQVAGDSTQDIDRRTAAIELLGYYPLDDVRATLAELIDVHEPDAVQIAAVKALADYADAGIADVLLAAWRSFTPPVRAAAINAMFARDDRILRLLQAALAERVSLAQVDAAQRARLREHRNAEVRRMAEQLFGGGSAKQRTATIAAYQKDLNGSGDIAAGEQIFKRECAACHKLGNTGHPIGPDLASSANRDADALLVHILDPNRYVLPNYVQYTVIDTDGRNHSGLITSQSSTSVTLQREKGEATTLLREDIDQLMDTGKSMMPEGLEQKISPAEMAHLIAFLQSVQTPTVEAPPPLDIGTEPGLVEPE